MSWVPSSATRGQRSSVVQLGSQQVEYDPHAPHKLAFHTIPPQEKHTCASLVTVYFIRNNIFIHLVIELLSQQSPDKY